MMFERGHPHWEGRWVGHLHLAFPSLESLDILVDSGSNVQIEDVDVNAIGRGDWDYDKSDDIIVVMKAVVTEAAVAKKMMICHNHEYFYPLQEN